MRVAFTSSGLLVSLIACCLGACAAKQRNFTPVDPEPEPTEVLTTTSTEPAPGDASATTEPEQGQNDAGARSTETTGASESKSTGDSAGAVSVPWVTDSSSQPVTDVTTSSERTAFSSSDEASTAESDSTASVTLWTDLVLHLTMDDAEWNSGGIVHDGSPAANHGTINGSVVQTADGKFDKAALFDGDGWITVPDSDSLDASSALSMSAWVNFGNVDGDYSPGIISKRRGFNYETAYALFLWDQDKVWVDVDYETDRFGSLVVFEVDRWYHVAMVYDGSAPAAERVHLYVDGVLDTVAPETSSEIPAFACDLEVGRLVNGGNTMIGMIDEVAVWRRALGSDEVARLASGPVQ